MQDRAVNEESCENLPIDFLVAFALFTISLLLRFINYNELSIWPDELNIYPRYAYATLSNNWIWSTESMLQPPLFTYILAVLTYLFGGSLEVFRIVSIIFGSLSVWVIYFLGKTLFDRRVGVLSAVLLCFSSYHIMYSKIVMLEATLIFFILSSIYYFAKSFQENDTKYACQCGLFLGLAAITKWNGILLYPVFFLFLLWTGRSIRTLFEKKFTLIVITSLAIQLPVWVYPLTCGENPLYFHLFGRFTSAKGTFYVYQQSPGLLELFTQGFDKFIHLLMDESSAATLSLPWFSTFKAVSSYLLVITILYYIYLVLKGKENDTLIFLYFIVFNIFVAFYGTKFEYYLLWAVPAFYIMLSNMGFRFFDYIRSRNIATPSNSIRILTLICLCIFVSYYVYTGSVAPFVNKGELIGYEGQILNIKDIADPGDAIATSFYRGTGFYLNKYDLDMNFFSLYYNIDVDLAMLREVKPRFILTSEYYYNSIITSEKSKIWINKYYNRISNEDGMLLFERKQEFNIHKIYKKDFDDEITGAIDHDIFCRSIPAHMTIGKPYDVLVHFKNTGEKPSTFITTLEVPDEFIFSSSRNRKIITLEKGESYSIRFVIVPIKEHEGELNITARLSTIKSRRNLPSSFIDLDNVSKSVLWVKSAHSMKDIAVFSMSIILIVGIILLIKKFR